MAPKAFITNEILFAYFAGRASALQKQMIENWVKEGPENEEYFYESLHEWETKFPQYEADVNLAIEKFNNAVIQNNSILTKTLDQSLDFGRVQKKKKFNWRKLLVAASVFFILVLNLYFFRDAITYKSYATGYGKTKTITLPDGSKVSLNANSVLRVPRFGFGKSGRNVYLNGEANFSVVHTPDHKRFVVRTDSLFKVEVLGTEFTVFARQRETKVILTKGKVKVHYGELEVKSRPVIMAPGDLIAVDKQYKKLKKKHVRQPENYAAWKQNRFVFDNTSLTEVKYILCENFGLDVEIQGDGLQEQTISGSFRAKTANDLLQAISEVLELNVMRENNHVILIQNH